MRDSDGERWLTIRQAVAETGKSRSAIMAWIAGGLPSQMVCGKRWVPETALFAKLRETLAIPRIKTRWSNKHRD